MEERREAIYEAGRELFLAEGFAGVSIRKIAARAGANSALISYYFGGKEGLYREVLERETRSIREFFSQEMGAWPPCEVIGGYARVMAAMHREHPGMCRVLIRLNLEPEGETISFMQGMMSSVYGTLRGALARGVQAGEFRADLDLHAATLQLVGIVNFGFITREARGSVSLGDTEGQEALYAEQALDIFLRGIRNEREK